MSSSPMDALGQVLNSLGEQFYQYSKERANQEAAQAQHQSDKDWTAGQSQLDRENQLAMVNAKDSRGWKLEERRDELRQKDKEATFRSLDYLTSTLNGMIEASEAPPSQSEMDVIQAAVVKQLGVKPNDPMVAMAVSSKVDAMMKQKREAYAPQIKSTQDTIRQMMVNAPGWQPLGYSPEKSIKLLNYNPDAVDPTRTIQPGGGAPKPGTPAALNFNNDEPGSVEAPAWSAGDSRWKGSSTSLWDAIINKNGDSRSKYASNFGGNSLPDNNSSPFQDGEYPDWMKKSKTESPFSPRDVEGMVSGVGRSGW